MQPDLHILQNLNEISSIGINGNNGKGDNIAESYREADGFDRDEPSFLSTLVGVANEQDLSKQSAQDPSTSTDLGTSEKKIAWMTLDNFPKDPESNPKMSGSSGDRLAALTAKDFLLKSGLGMNNAEKGADALIATHSKDLSPSSLLGVNGNPQNFIQAGEKGAVIETDLLSRLGFNQDSGEGKPEEVISGSVQKRPSLKEVIVKPGDTDTKQAIFSDEVKAGKTGNMGNKEIQLKLNLISQGIENIAGSQSDNGSTEFLSSNNQTFDRSSETFLPSKETEFTQKSFENDVLKQIVEKFVFSHKNGQTAVKISLKPEFLGNLELKISTVDHQVMVKILTEVPLVKDVIDNNMHELKAALQNQGLELDKFDVLVATDSDQKGKEYETLSFFGMGGDRTDNDKEDAASTEEIENTARIMEKRREMGRIDFFA